MGTKLLYEKEKEKEKEEVIEEDELDEDELDELEELEEMTPPRLSCWDGEDGKKHYEIVVIDNDIKHVLKNKLHMFEPCSICFLPISTRGEHRISCLPCGHLYGLSCIKKGLIQSSSVGQCPQCNLVFESKGVIPLYTSRVCPDAHQKVSSTRHFPFTKQGLTEFREHERLRCVDTEKMHAEDSKKLVDVLKHHFDAVDKQCALLAQAKDLFAKAEKLEQRAVKLGKVLALRQVARALEQQADAFGRRCVAWRRRADVLEQHKDELERRLSAFKGISSNCFYQMCKEHLAQQMNSES